MSGLTMEITLFFVAVLLQMIALCHATSPVPPTNLLKSGHTDLGIYSEKIVGGEAVQNCTYYPYHVSFQKKVTLTGEYTHFCGGSVLSKDYVLTAGHCAKGLKLFSFSVVVGTHKFDPTGKIGIRRNAASVTVHKQYDSNLVDYDVAVIKLEKSLDLEHECVSAVTLPEQDEEIKVGTLCVAAGFGTVKEGASGLSSTLRVVGLPVVSQENCKASHGKDDITPRMFCAGLENGGKDACQGDSGGPFTIDGKQVGITSWGQGCARPGFYGVYTRVAFFSQWIKNQIR